MPKVEQALKLYVSWAKESQDDQLAMQLKKHLAMLERRKLIDIWGEIEAGLEVDKEEVKRINASDIILLLISVDFFNDKNCIEDLQLALKRYEQEEESAFVIPVLLRTTYMESTVLTKLKLLPSEKYPVVHKHWENIDEAFTRVVDEIMKVVKYATRKKESLAEHVIKDDKLEITNPSYKDYKEAVEAMNVRSVSSAGDIGGIQNTVGTTKQEKIIDNYLDKSSKVKSVIVDDIEISRAELLLKKAILLHKSAIRNEDTKKLEEAFQLLEQARALEPRNIEVLLELAKVLVVLTPDDPTDEEEILEQIELMVQNPKDDETAFYLAQARLMLATSNLKYIDEELLQKAKKTFVKLGNKQMVADCEAMLEMAAENRKPKISVLPKKSNVLLPPPLPNVQPFHPVGQWDIEIHSLIPNSMYLDIYPNGTLNGKQVYMPFHGNWSFQNNYLYIQGYISGFPFEMAVQIQFQQNGDYIGQGVDGNRYVFKRIVTPTAQGFSSGMR
jgi:TIR domain-containing protein